MSTLLLIRHAQASFGAEDYDVLSDLGAEQARALGHHLARIGLRPDALYAGPRVRHRDTVHHLAAAASGEGLALPSPVVMEELDEYPALALFRRWLPRLKTEEPELVAAATGKAGPRALDRALERVVSRWARGDLDSGDLESYPDFCERVHRGLDALIEAEGRGVTVLAVTSGGPISLAVRRALELSPERGMKVAWVLSNTSLSEFRYRDTADLSLVRMNSIPHLQERRHLITFR